MKKRWISTGLFLALAVAVAYFATHSAPETEELVQAGWNGVETTTELFTTTTESSVTTTEPSQQNEQTRGSKPANKSYILKDVPYINQKAKYPTGCESVCAVMALQYAGYSITVDEFIDDHLPRSNAPYWENGAMVANDPMNSYLGDPRTKSGWGCFAPAIYTAAVSVTGDAQQVKNVSGQSLDELCRDYIDAGVPVILWGTIGMLSASVNCRFTAADTKREVVWKIPEHCLLLIGYDDKSYYFNDPYSSAGRTFARSSVERAYTAMDCQAVVVLPQTSASTVADEGINLQSTP